MNPNIARLPYPSFKRLEALLKKKISEKDGKYHIKTKDKFIDEVMKWVIDGNKAILHNQAIQMGEGNEHLKAKIDARNIPIQDKLSELVNKPFTFEQLKACIIEATDAYCNKQDASNEHEYIDKKIQKINANVEGLLSVFSQLREDINKLDTACDSKGKTTIDQDINQWKKIKQEETLRQILQLTKIMLRWKKVIKEKYDSEHEWVISSHARKFSFKKRKAEYKSIKSAYQLIQRLESIEPQISAWRNHIASELSRTKKQGLIQVIDEAAALILDYKDTGKTKNDVLSTIKTQHKQVYNRLDEMQFKLECVEHRLNTINALFDRLFLKRFKADQVDDFFEDDGFFSEVKKAFDSILDLADYWDERLQKAKHQGSKRDEIGNRKNGTSPEQKDKEEDLNASELDKLENAINSVFADLPIKINGTDKVEGFRSWFLSFKKTIFEVFDKKLPDDKSFFPSCSSSPDQHLKEIDLLLEKVKEYKIRINQVRENYSILTPLTQIEENKGQPIINALEFDFGHKAKASVSSVLRVNLEHHVEKAEETLNDESYKIEVYVQTFWDKFFDDYILKTLKEKYYPDKSKDGLQLRNDKHSQDDASDSELQKIRNYVKQRARILKNFWGLHDKQDKAINEINKLIDPFFEDDTSYQTNVIKKYFADYLVELKAYYHEKIFEIIKAHGMYSLDEFKSVTEGYWINVTDDYLKPAAIDVTAALLDHLNQNVSLTSSANNATGYSQPLLNRLKETIDQHFKELCEAIPENIYRDDLLSQGDRVTPFKSYETRKGAIDDFNQSISPFINKKFAREKILHKRFESAAKEESKAKAKNQAIIKKHVGQKGNYDEIVNEIMTFAVDDENESQETRPQIPNKTQTVIKTYFDLLEDEKRRDQLVKELMGFVDEDDDDGLRGVEEYDPITTAQLLTNHLIDAEQSQSEDEFKNLLNERKKHRLDFDAHNTEIMNDKRRNEIIRRIMKFAVEESDDNRKGDKRYDQSTRKRLRKDFIDVEQDWNTRHIFDQYRNIFDDLLNNKSVQTQVAFLLNKIQQINIQQWNDAFKTIFDDELSRRLNHFYRIQDITSPDDRALVMGEVAASDSQGRDKIVEFIKADKFSELNQLLNKLLPVDLPDLGNELSDFSQRWKAVDDDSSNQAPNDQTHPLIIGLIKSNDYENSMTIDQLKKRLVEYKKDIDQRFSRQMPSIFTQAELSYLNEIEAALDRLDLELNNYRQDSILARDFRSIIKDLDHEMDRIEEEIKLFQKPSSATRNKLNSTFTKAFNEYRKKQGKQENRDAIVKFELNADTTWVEIVAKFEEYEKAYLSASKALNMTHVHAIDDIIKENESVLDAEMAKKNDYLQAIHEKFNILCQSYAEPESSYVPCSTNREMRERINGYKNTHKKLKAQIPEISTFEFIRRNKAKIVECRGLIKAINECVEGRLNIADRSKEKKAAKKQKYYNKITQALQNNLPMGQNANAIENKNKQKDKNYYQARYIFNLMFGIYTLTEESYTEAYDKAFVEKGETKSYYQYIFIAVSLQLGNFFNEKKPFQIYQVDKQMFIQLSRTTQKNLRCLKTSLHLSEQDIKDVQFSITTFMASMVLYAEHECGTIQEKSQFLTKLNLCLFDKRQQRVDPFIESAIKDFQAVIPKGNTDVEYTIKQSIFSTLGTWVNGYEQYLVSPNNKKFSALEKIADIDVPRYLSFFTDQIDDVINILSQLILQQGSMNAEDDKYCKHFCESLEKIIFSKKKDIIENPKTKEEQIKKALDIRARSITKELTKLEKTGAINGNGKRKQSIDRIIAIVKQYIKGSIKLYSQVYKHLSPNIQERIIESQELLVDLEFLGKQKDLESYHQLFKQALSGNGVNSLSTLLTSGQEANKKFNKKLRQLKACADNIRRKLLVVQLEIEKFVEENSNVDVNKTALEYWFDKSENYIWDTEAAKMIFQSYLSQAPQNSEEAEAFMQTINVENSNAFMQTVKELIINSVCHNQYAHERLKEERIQKQYEGVYQTNEKLKLGVASITKTIKDSQALVYAVNEDITALNEPRDEKDETAV
jgi:hypothetical protein